MKTLSLEPRFSGYLIALFITLLVTGFANLLLPSGILEQTISISHLLVGFIFTPVVLIYLALHFVKTISARRPAVLLLGIITAAIFIGMIFTGLMIYNQGNLSTSSYYLVHLSLSFLAIFFLLAHISYFLVRHPVKRRRKVSAQKDLSFWPSAKLQILYLLSVVVVISGSLYLFHTVNYQPNSGEPYVENYQYAYGDGHFLPSLTETHNNQFIDYNKLNNSDFCAECHPVIFDQWQSSAHRQASSDKAYETNINLLVANKGIAAARYCEGCHAPLALLGGTLSEGGLHGGVENTAANEQGVNCLSCHGIRKTLSTKGVASYLFKLPEPYLLEGADNPLLSAINRHAIDINPEQHRQDMKTTEMSDSVYCATCHSQFMDEDLNDWGWVQMQDDYNDWLQGPYSGHTAPEFAHQKQMHCQDCHMPKVQADDPAADEAGMVRSHRYLAANTMLPLLDGDDEQLEMTKEFLKSNKITVSIDKPYRDDATHNSMAFTEALREPSVQPFYFYKGENIDLKVVVANQGVGHSFPAGTVDINEAWVAISVKDIEGNDIYSSGMIEEGEPLPGSAYTYQSIPIDRQGKHVWRHDLFNMIGEVSKNVIGAGESDVVEYSFKVPYWAKGPLSIYTSVRYRKLNHRYSVWALQDEYQPLPIVDMARDYLSVPIREVSEVYTGDAAVSSNN